ncbi:MAG: helix-turn-helix domain-containing protein [Oscillospiraceae bacterium]|nr:helix-turn-helix domain-containing protein [Oscillospiraceae bacterium]
MTLQFDNFRIFRKQCGLTQEEVAEKLGVSRQAVAKWERGETAPDIEFCIKLAELYGTTVDALVSKAYTHDDDPDGRKHAFGVAKVNDKGQITLPKKARDIFNIKSGDSLLILGEEGRGIAIINLGSMPTE